MRPRSKPQPFSTGPDPAYSASPAHRDCTHSQQWSFSHPRRGRETNKADRDPIQSQPLKNLRGDFPLASPPERYINSPRHGASYPQLLRAPKPLHSSNTKLL